MMRRTTMVVLLLLLAVGCSGQTEKKPDQDDPEKQARERERQAREQAQKNLKQLVIAQHNSQDEAGKLPVGVSVQGGFPPFVSHLLPHLEGEKTFAQVPKFVAELGGKSEVDGKVPGKPVLRIDLSHSKVTDQELARLPLLLRFAQSYQARFGSTDKEPPQLRELNLRDTKITDAGLKELTGLKQLRKLDLSGTKVTDAAVKDLKKALPNCTVVR